MDTPAPLTLEHIRKWWFSENFDHNMALDTFTAVIRATEKLHGITDNPKETPH